MTGLKMYCLRDFMFMWEKPENDATQLFPFLSLPPVTYPLDWRPSWSHEKTRCLPRFCRKRLTNFTTDKVSRPLSAPLKVQVQLLVYLTTAVVRKGKRKERRHRERLRKQEVKEGEVGFGRDRDPSQSYLLQLCNPLQNQRHLLRGRYSDWF